MPPQPPGLSNVSRAPRCAFAHPLQMPVFEIDTRRVFALCGERDLDFGQQVGVMLPVRADPPREHEPPRRIPDEHVAPVGFAAVVVDAVPAAADARVPGRLPSAAHLPIVCERGHQRSNPAVKTSNARCGGGGNRERLADRRGFDRAAHFFSRPPFLPGSARRPRPEMRRAPYPRTDRATRAPRPSPLGSI